MNHVLITCTAIVTFEAALCVGLLMQHRASEPKPGPAAEQIEFTETEFLEMAKAADGPPEEEPSPSTPAPRVVYVPEDNSFELDQLKPDMDSELSGLRLEVERGAKTLKSTQDAKEKLEREVNSLRWEVDSEIDKQRKDLEDYKSRMWRFERWAY